MLPKGNARGKNKYFFLTLSMYHLFKKKGARLKSLPVEKQKITQKYRPRSWSKITTLKFRILISMEMVHIPQHGDNDISWESNEDFEKGDSEIFIAHRGRKWGPVLLRYLSPRVYTKKMWEKDGKCRKNPGKVSVSSFGGWMAMGRHTAT